MKAKIEAFKVVGLRRGKLLLDLDGDFRNQYDKLKDCDVEVTIEKYSEPRSLNANAYLWALVTKIGNALRENKEDIYFDLLKSYGQGFVASIRETDEKRFLRSYRYREYMGESMNNGKLFKHYRVWIGSSEYSRAEFAILLDGAIQEAENLGIPTKTQEEIDRMLERMEA